MFPILGGRLLKLLLKFVPYKPEKFPILGGRLLKEPIALPASRSSNVSNPWREAIEEKGSRCKTPA